MPGPDGRGPVAWFGLAVLALAVAGATGCGSSSSSGNAGADETTAPATTTIQPAGDASTDKLAQVLARGTLVLFTDPKYPPQSVQVAGAKRPANTKCAANQLTAGSGLAKLYPGVTVTKTNSIHHQAIKDVGRDLVVEAWSEPDRVVEALRSTGTAYVFAVQWHPEFHAPGDPSFIDDTPILDDFLAAARQHKAAAYAI